MGNVGVVRQGRVHHGGQLLPRVPHLHPRPVAPEARRSWLFYGAGLQNVFSLSCVRLCPLIRPSVCSHVSISVLACASWYALSSSSRPLLLTLFLPSSPLLHPPLSTVPLSRRSAVSLSQLLSLSLILGAGRVPEQVGLAIQHDANHGGVSPKGWVNQFWGYTQDWIGGSSLLWRHHHVLMHHAGLSPLLLPASPHLSLPLPASRPHSSLVARCLPHMCLAVCGKRG